MSKRKVSCLQSVTPVFLVADPLQDAQPTPEANEHVNVNLDERARTRFELESAAGVWLLEEATEFVTSPTRAGRLDAAFDILGIIIAYLGIINHDETLAALRTFRLAQRGRGRPLNVDADGIMSMLLHVASGRTARAASLMMLSARHARPAKAHLRHVLEGALLSSEAKKRKIGRAVKKLRARQRACNIIHRGGVLVTPPRFLFICPT